MKRAIIYMLGVLILFTSCESCKRPNEHNDTEYTISGTFYDNDGATPIPHKELLFYGEVKTGFSGRIEELGQTSTDKDGKFSITYKHTTSEFRDGIIIGQPSDILPVYGPFMTHIPKNQDIHQDLCIYPRLEYNYSIKYSPKSKGDTLFIYSAFVPIESHPLNLVQAGAVYVILDSISNNHIEAKQAGSSNGNYNGRKLLVYYCNNRENFEKVFNSKKIPDNILEYVNEQEYHLKPFPEVNTIEIKLE